MLPAALLTWLCNNLPGTQGDYDTVNIVKQSFVDAGLETTLDQYEVLLNWPIEVRVFC